LYQVSTGPRAWTDEIDGSSSFTVFAGLLSGWGETLRRVGSRNSTKGASRVKSPDDSREVGIQWMLLLLLLKRDEVLLQQQIADDQRA
jgi:hypothetical protein